MIGESDGDTRQRLLDMRAQLVAGLGEQIDAGYLSMIAGVQAALAALDVTERPVDAEPMARAIVVDISEQAIRLTLYAEDGRPVAVPLSPIRALVLAGKLVEASARRLA